MLCSSEVDSALGVIEGGPHNRLHNHKRGGEFTLQIMHTEEGRALSFGHFKGIACLDQCASILQQQPE